MMKIRYVMLGLLLALGLVQAQTDPGAQQDKEEERLKILRAVDQLDSMSSQLDTLRAQSDQQKSQIESLQSQLADLKSDNVQLNNDIATLKASIEKLDAARAEERDVLLKKVGEIVAEAMKSRPTPPVETPKKEDAPRAAAASGNDEKGYTYVVKKGDTLSAISSAYEAQGVKVTVDDLRKANNLDKSSKLSIGQKLFIPQK